MKDLCNTLVKWLINGVGARVEVVEPWMKETKQTKFPRVGVAWFVKEGVYMSLCDADSKFCLFKTSSFREARIKIKKFVSCISINVIVSSGVRKNKKLSVAGNRTRVSWVKARYPNRWTTTDLLFVIYRKYNMIPFSFRLEQKIENFGCTWRPGLSIVATTIGIKALVHIIKSCWKHS